MKSRDLIIAGAILAGLGVGFGAFGAHALHDRISSEALGWWHTGVGYQMWHGLAVLALGLSDRASLRPPAWLMVAGAIIFAGTLYAMALGGPRWLGAITPLGGLLMIAGWALVCWRAARENRQ